MHFSFGVNGQPQQNFNQQQQQQLTNQQQQYNVQLPQETSNQQQQFNQQNQYQQQTQNQQQSWTTGMHPPPSQQSWSQGGQLMQNFPSQSSNIDAFGSQSAVNNAYQPEAPPTYEFEEKKEVPRY